MHAAKTSTIKCACGDTLRCRPNRNGVVVCKRCGSVKSPAQFRVPKIEREEIIHDFTAVR